MITRSILLARLPSFCWQDAQEVLTMMDSDGVHLDLSHVLILLRKAYDDGDVERKPSAGAWKRDGRKRWLYRKADDA